MSKTLAAVPELTNRVVARAALTIAGILLGFWIVIQAQEALVTLVTAIILSTAMMPLVLRLEKYGIPRAAGILLTYFLLFVLLGVAIWFGGNTLWRQVSTLLDAVPRFYDQLRSMMEASDQFIVKRLGLSLPPDLPFERGAIIEPPADAENGQAQLSSLLVLSQYVTSILRGAIFVTITFALAGYWTMYGERNIRGLLIFVPSRSRDEIRELIKQIEDKLGRFVIGQLILMLSIGVASFIAYWIIGLPNKLALAIFAGLMEAIPVVGPILGTVPAFAVGVGVSPLQGAWVLVAGLVIQALENNILVPRIMGSAVGVNPLVTLLAFVAFSSLFGLLGAVISIPLAATIQILLDRYLLRRKAEEQLTLDGRDAQSRLRYEAQKLIGDLRQRLAADETAEAAQQDHLTDSLEAIATDLDQILAGGAQR